LGQPLAEGNRFEKRGALGAVHHYLAALITDGPAAAGDGRMKRAAHGTEGGGVGREIRWGSIS